MLKKDEVFEELKNRILRLEYEPGLILSETELAEDLGVSRTPIRHAFQKLELHKLLTVVPRYGTQVSQIDFMSMKALFEVDMVLDPFATRLATEKLTDEEIDKLQEIVDRLVSYDMDTQYKEAIIDDQNFHDIILEATKNIWLQETLEGMHYHSERLWHYCDTFFQESDIFHDTLGKIVKAIKQRDGDLAAQYAKEHIEKFVDKIRVTLL